MNTNRNLFRRTLAMMSAAALMFGLAAPAVVGSVANAAQVQSRSIALSDSTPGAAAQYKLTFTASQAATELVVDFCGDSPIVGASCAFSSSTVPTISSPVSSLGTAATVGSGSPVHTVKVTGLTIPAGSAFTVTFTSGFTNPSGTGSFYARVLTYGTGGAAGYAPANTTGAATTTGSDLDYGGVALSTAANVSISATVMETLTFCTSGLVTGAAPTTCASTSTPSVTLGSGTPPTIDSSAVYDNSAGNYRSYMILSTNASNGAIVAMKSKWTCNGLSSDSGASCGIPGQSGALTAGTAGFGLKVANGSGGTGTIQAANSYSATTFHMGSTGSATTYGDTIANTNTQPCSNVVSQLTFGATAGLTTPAGIYQSNEILIATGTF